jgi:hypothetical protein
VPSFTLFHFITPACHIPLVALPAKIATPSSQKKKIFHLTNHIKGHFPLPNPQQQQQENRKCEKPRPRKKEKKEEKEGTPRSAIPTKQGQSSHT